MNDFNDKARYDKIQRLNKAEWLDPYYRRHDDLYRDGNPLGSLFLITMGMVMGMLFLAGVRKCDKDYQPAAVATQTICQTCHYHQSL